MEEAISLHVICRLEGIRPKGAQPINEKKDIYESVSWRIPKEDIPNLKGKLFCMHEAKAEPSYFGGIIEDIVLREIEDNNGEIRSVVIFKVDPLAKKVAWPPTNNPNEFVNVHYGAAL